MQLLRVVPRYKKKWADVERKPGVYNRGKWIGPLPKTPFWETDLVRTLHGDILRVDLIDYDPNAREEPRYVCCLELLGSVRYKASQLTLIERGPVWKRLHGKRAQFVNAYEEALFHVNMRWAAPVYSVPGDKSSNRWSLSEIWHRVGYGGNQRVDVITRTLDGQYLRAYRLWDEKVGKACREVMTEKYKMGRLWDLMI